MNRLEDYLRTLEICRVALPPATEPMHYERLRIIEQIVRRALVDRTINRLAGIEMFDLADYLRTLEICRNALPPATERIHYGRLRRIERMVRRAFAETTIDHAAEFRMFYQWFRNDALGG